MTTDAERSRLQFIVDEFAAELDAINEVMIYALNEDQPAMTTQYRFKISHDPPHLAPVHTFTPWRDDKDQPRFDLFDALGQLEPVAIGYAAYALCREDGEPVGSAELEKRERPEG